MGIDEVTLLEAFGIVKTFGGVQALRRVSLVVPTGQFLGLIGPNGSGKTTLINCLTAFTPVDAGEIRFAGDRVDRLSAFRVSRLGIGRTFQICKVFRRLTVLQNLMVAGLTRRGSTGEAVGKRANVVLRRVGLEHQASLRAGHLSGGQQKLLECATVLMLDPKLVLLDEPFAGVHPELKQALVDLLLELHGEGRTILLVSHDMSSVFRLCQRVVVLDKGEIVVDGPPSAVRGEPRLSVAYRGS
jgi:ABC-type branched-subunit amino acid transport system ATPase component